MASKAPFARAWRPTSSTELASARKPFQATRSRRHYASFGKHGTGWHFNSSSIPATKLGPRTFRRAAASEAAADARSVATRAKNLLLGTALGLTLAAGYFYATDTRAGIHEWLVVPLLRYAYPDGEDAHVFGNKALKMLHAFGLHPRERGDPDSTGDLETTVFGHVLANPIGLSAGIDKHAEIPWPLFALGSSIIELGGATPYPQDGNPRPRVFRIDSRKALINRYGLNSEGADFIAMRLRQRVREYAKSIGLGIDEAAEKAVLDGDAGVFPGSLTQSKLLAVQIAKNKFTPNDDIEKVKADYRYCTERLGKYADIITCNFSSPNTPGLRKLQEGRILTEILTSVVEAARRVDRKTPVRVMVKVSPDEDSDEQIRGVCDAVWRSGVDGVIVGNTTVTRPDPISGTQTLTRAEAQAMTEMGGYSGPELFGKTLAMVKRYRHFLDEGVHATSQDPTRKGQAKVIFASGGITNGKEALQVLEAGASVAMVYTAVVYGGAGTVSRIKSEMRELRKEVRTQAAST